MTRLVANWAHQTLTDIVPRRNKTRAWHPFNGGKESDKKWNVAGRVQGDILGEPVNKALADFETTFLRNRSQERWASQGGRLCRRGQVVASLGPTHRQVAARVARAIGLVLTLRGNTTITRMAYEVSRAKSREHHQSPKGHENADRLCTRHC